MTEDEDKIMRLLERVSQDVARIQKERDEARAEASRSETQLQATLFQHRRDIRELGELLHDERNQVVAVTAERDVWRKEAETLKAEAARAVEALEAIRNELATISGKKDRVIHNDFTSGEAHGWDTAHLHVVEITGKIAAQPALDWLAAQKREYAAEELEAKGRKFKSYRHSNDFVNIAYEVLANELFERAAALRAGDVTE